MKTDQQSRLTFFHQTGWMVVATGVGGLFMWAVHVPAQRMPPAEYGVLGALLQVLNLMLIPSIALQTIFAQQTAAAVTERLQRQLAYTLRRVLAGVFVLWAVVALVTFAFRAQLLSGLQIGNPASLWITLVIGLTMLWAPILQGTLQGQQNFLWLGWLQILNGLGRLSGVLILVLWLGHHAAGAMTAALLANAVCLVVAGWQCRAVGLGAGEPIRWRSWLAGVVPLTLGLAAGQLMMSWDSIVVQNVFDRELTAYYVAPSMIGKALIFLTGALVAVMFPKVVRSVALAEKTDVVLLAVGTTVLLGGGAAIVCTLWPKLPLWVVYSWFRPEYLASAPLVPWFAWCLLPLSLANVLIGNLLARKRYAVVPWLLLIAASYCVVLKLRAKGFGGLEHFAAFKMVVQTLGLFSTSLCLVAAWFTWRKSPADAQPLAATTVVPQV